MMFALISYRGEKVADVILQNIPLLNNRENRISKKEMNDRVEHNTEEQDFDGF